MNKANKLTDQIIVTMLLFSLIFAAPELIRRVEASEGSAEVYILKLNGVGASCVGSQDDAVAGAMQACTPRERHDNIPRAHPKYGETAPYYEINYQVISDWSTYVNIILYGVEVILVNTHGQILPVPNGYPNEGWVDTIADAMINRSVKWAHMACYPFYYVWHEGATQESFWGPNGFKALMNHVGLYNAELAIDPSPGSKAELGPSADKIFKATTSWSGFENASKVLLWRPMRQSFFKDYCALPIYQIGPINGEFYWEGAVIAFAKPGQRLNFEENVGFGAFIHLGTSKTYAAGDAETNSDKWRAYVATAAAIWVATMNFEDARDIAFNEETEEYTGIRVVPNVVSHKLNDEETQVIVRLGFSIYGIVKAPLSSQGEHYIQPGGITFCVNGSVDNWMFQADISESRDAALFNDNLTGVWSDVKLVASTILWFAGWACTEAAPLFATLGGIILLSNWQQRLSGVYATWGVTEPSTVVLFSYSPSIQRTNQNGCRHDEFQSMIFVDVYIPKQTITDWRVIPFDFTVSVSTYDGLDATAQGAGSLTVWLDNSDEVSVFLQDFEDEMGGWNAEDKNPASGLDYWNVSYYHSSHDVWCAQVGYNEVRGKYNFEAMEYDKNMNAWLTYNVDLRPYQWANLSYWIEYDLRNDPDDILELYFRVGDTWHSLNKSYTSDCDWFWDSVNVSSDATEIGFRFYSDGDNNIDLGVFLDNIGLRAKLPNDAPYSGTDARNFTNPNPIFVSGTWTNYAGYLGVLSDVEDWYSFSVGSGQLIEVNLNPPSNVDFKMELYDQNGTKKAGPAEFVHYAPTTAENGTWRIKIYTNSGSGQYSFDIRTRDIKAAMKTESHGSQPGYFYIPAVASDLLKIELLFDVQNFTGDQTGNALPPYTLISDWPDGKVDTKDLFFVSKKYGAYEGDANWNYMADVHADGKIDIKDIFPVSKNYGYIGTYPQLNLTGIEIIFNTGQILTPDTNGFISIPQGAANFTITRNGTPIGAMIIFW